jgi:hypothetical protein
VSGLEPGLVPVTDPRRVAPEVLDGGGNALQPQPLARALERVEQLLRAHQLIAQVVADAIRESGIAGPTVRWNPDAYVAPDPEALLDANPDLRFKENLVRLFACDVGGRPECSPQ